MMLTKKKKLEKEIKKKLKKLEKLKKTLNKIKKQEKKVKTAPPAVHEMTKGFTGEYSRKT